MSRLLFLLAATVAFSLAVALLPAARSPEARRNWWPLAGTMLLSAAAFIPLWASFAGMEGIGWTAQFVCALLAVFGAPAAALCNAWQGRRAWQGPILWLVGVAGTWLFHALASYGHLRDWPRF